MTLNSRVLVAYEINADLGRRVIQNAGGIMARMKRFNVSALVDHVTKSWRHIEEPIQRLGYSFEGKILYTVNLDQGLAVQDTNIKEINNSFLMSVLLSSPQSGRNGTDNLRFHNYETDAEFEKKQFSISLEEFSSHFVNQEIGCFGWISIPSDNVDAILKEVSTAFPESLYGELHFIEFDSRGNVFPNFADVKSKKFSGKLAGNYGMTLNVSEITPGIEAINKIVGLAIRKDVDLTSATQPQNQPPQSQLESVSVNSETVDSSVSGVSSEARTEKLVDVKSSFDRLGFVDWLQSASVDGQVDGDGDLCVTLEADKPSGLGKRTLLLKGEGLLEFSGLSEAFVLQEQISTESSVFLRSDYMRVKKNQSSAFKYSLKFDVYERGQVFTVPIVIGDCANDNLPLVANQIKITKLNAHLDEDNVEITGVVTGPKGFVYLFTADTSPPDEYFSASERCVDDDSDVDEVQRYLWDVKEGDTIYVSLAQFVPIDQNISIEFDGTPEFDALSSDSLLQITQQEEGSIEFKIEVASACAESGENYKDFAQRYNLDPDELNEWAADYLGEKFEESSPDEYGVDDYNDQPDDDTAGGSNEKKENGMIVSIDVYTKDIDAGLAAFKVAVQNGATNVQLRSNEDWDTKKFENLNLMFDADHKSAAVEQLDNGPFVKDTDDL